jgi:hypothetical protein
MSELAMIVINRIYDNCQVSCAFLRKLESDFSNLMNF